MGNDLVMDAALDYIATSTILCVCSAQPATYAEMTATYDLATHIMAGGDFAKANGDTNGRKVTVVQQAAITVDHTGAAATDYTVKFVSTLSNGNKLQDDYLVRVVT